LPRIRAIYANHHGFADLNLPIALQKVLAEGIEISRELKLAKTIGLVQVFRFQMAYPLAEVASLAREW
jgi:hypothetical protein